MSFVERLTAECEGMTELAQRGFAQLGNNGEGELERYVADFPSSSSRPAHILMTYSTRLECRNANSGLTELDEKLQALPLGDGYNSTEDGRMLPLLPEDGQAIRDMDREFAERSLVSQLTVRRPSSREGTWRLRATFPAENVFV